MTWEVIGSGDYITHVLVVDGVRKAAVWFSTRHAVWDASFPRESSQQIGRTWESLEAAKSSIEGDYMERAW